MKIKYFFWLLLAVITLGTTNYSTLYYLGVDVKNSIWPKALNLISILLIFSISFVNFFYNRVLINRIYLNIYLILISYVLLISFFLNLPMEYTPSAFRFFSYYFIAILTYNYLKIYGISSFHRMMKLFLLFNVAIAIVFGYLEVILNDVQFLNGAYRLSGTFKFHQLGNGMYLGALLILWFEFYLIKERKVKWLNVIIFLSLFYLFFNTHSRMLIVLLFFTYALYYIISVKKILKFIKISLLILGIAVSSILIIVKTDISPRLKTVFVSTESLRDPSTMERIEIFENTYNGMYLYQKIFGLGMGGFNKFYEEVTNRIGVAAHNNFLLFFAEGGGIGLFLFIVYQFSLFYTLVRFVRKQSTIKNQIYLARLCFVLIFVFEIGAFLLNNYYFFCSQAVVWIFMGYFTFINSRYNQIHHNKGLNETS